LAEALSRRGRHRDAVSLRASRRASTEYGAESARLQAVEDAAGVALGAELDAVHAAGAALGDSGAVTLARHLGRDDRGMAS
jgi:hypothetical protein